MKLIFGKETIRCDYGDSQEEFIIQDINAQNLVSLLEKCVSADKNLEFEANPDASPFSIKLKELIETAFKQESTS